MIDDPIAVFLVEAGETLEQIEQGLLDLGANLEDRALIDAVFRGLHTLKGSGAMFGFDALAAFTHHCENAFDRARKGDVAVTPDLVNVILTAQDHMRALIERPADDHGDTGRDILARLEAAVGTSGALAPAPAPAQADRPMPGRGWRLCLVLPDDVLVTGTNPLGLLDELRALGEATVRLSTEGVPTLDQLDPTRCHLGWTIDLIGDVARDKLDDVFIFVMDGIELTVEALGEAEDAAPPATSSAPSPGVAPVAAAPAPDRRADAPAAKAPVRAIESVRVPADRLDDLMDRVGELVIAQSRLSQVAGAAHDMGLRSISEEIQRLANELRDTMMVLRMVPVGTLFARFRRLAHDLSNELGKPVDFVAEGETVEVDKTVVERLSDPLVHLIRNACDHGLEDPGERAAAGKAPAGRIELSARQTGSEIVITVRDDGRGMNRAAIRARAESQGLIPPGQPVSDQDLLQMIFQPGFSTAAQVTNLSGRGVGMDVVKRTIDQLRGRIEVASEPGQGSRVTLRIPQTLAIIEGLLVRVGAGRYVIPLAAVEECLELSRQDDARLGDSGVVTLRDRLVPLLRMRALFEAGGRPDPHQKIVVISKDGGRMGLIVDQIIGSHQTVIKAMSPLHRGVAAFAGATILGDGGVALILDVAHLAAVPHPQEERLRAAG